MFPRSFPVPPQAKSKLYTVSDMFYPDPSATWVYVEGIGGGQAGGTFGGQGPAGGDGGAWDWALIPVSAITGPVAVVIGAGGVAISNSSSRGPIGGDTKFGNSLTCKGGGNNFNVDGLGGLGSVSGLASPGSNSVRGGAGGGGGSSTGTAGAGGTSLRGGNGGAGGTNGGAAGNGAVPGGGGGGNGSSGVLGGNGARGQMNVYQW